MGGVEAIARDTGATFPPSSSAPNTTDDSSSLEGREGRESPQKPGSVSPDIAHDANGWRDEKDRLLDRLFAWKAGEAWREVVLVCGAAEGRGARGGLRSACELEVRARHIVDR